ncbi:hypothetical protein GCM10023219_08760 [Stakelama sediminis]|uniref:CelD/BcsL family acetyltransferase involved in cellulose biosynthesis n=1 Tax=Stakelama sediminis TaxID=463200 RepID=A0A840YVC5_9SPHN|nr:GNAT family N-acetyltransferase [Stakelama sediminis]MBB5717598.1 CelD/BcsL family acetyltransferase involved in cellulose biosynthesis [Stakelama sediminis]
MSVAVRWPLKFQIGARTLWSVRRELIRVPLSLNEALGEAAPVLPPLPRAGHGYLLTSLPDRMLPSLIASSAGMVAFTRQRYTRYYIDLTSGFDAWFSGLSGNTRSQIRRKEKRIRAADGGILDVRRFDTPDGMMEFHQAARKVAVHTYQERLLGAGLPDTPEFVANMLAQAAAGHVRAWLLCLDGEPVAYLYCPIHGGTVLYEYLGHDPAHSDLSPGTVLQVEALRSLFAEDGLNRFDFTEGEGQHKRQMASAGIDCVDLLLLKPTLGNRCVVLALAGFDGAVHAAKRMVRQLGLGRMAKRLRRG